MYYWKIPKFRFGRNKEDKEAEKEKEKEKNSTNRINSGGFHYHKDGARYDNGNNTINGDNSSEPGGTKSNSERKETIIPSNSSIAPVRLSHDASSTTSTVRESSGGRTSEDVFNGTPDTHRSDDPSPPEISITAPAQSTSTPGILTIKVYNGDGFILPFPITSNEQILGKLLGSGVTSKRSGVSDEVDGLVSQLSRMQLQNQGPIDENLLPGDIATKFIPSTIMLPGSEHLNPLLYFTIEFDNTVATIEPEYGSMVQPVFNKISTFDVTRKLPYFKIDVFARIPSILLPSKTWQQEMGVKDERLREMFSKINTNQDIHLDSFLLPVNLKIDSAANIRLYNHHWVKLEHGRGNINFSVDYKPSKNKSLSIDDFDLLKVIGKGSFGKVMQVKKKDTQKVYALKAVRKSYIVSKSEVTHTLAERTVLARVECPFIVPLKFSFQSQEKLYLVLAFINGGELFYHLQKEGRFDLSRARFYTAELLCALETLHSLDVIYRDLKPENILLDYQGHIALCDFGLCKLNMTDKDKTDTFCGTPEYLAPELLLGQGYSKIVDWWTLGVLLYEMLTGLPPYYDEDVPKMYKKILQEPLRFPDGFDHDAKDLLIGLLSRDPKRRLGYHGAEEIRSHPFFSQLSWRRLLMKGYIPPYKPPVSNAMDTSNFDQEFTREKPIDSVVDEYLSESVQKQFGGWTYVGNEQLGSSMFQGRSIR
ncbi:serine/threonine protein kinase, AGC [Zygosaccharomyces mellis]|uniref:non-specific serine/threonine protein kinase n=1 Tax=Zygosaccharomyces mellis TaxID=42258 RepID=A0A4C2E6M7_9SACH|nr:serine/threonine protein kinase, AGC [Zygosaccharomyces mellis]